MQGFCGEVLRGTEVGTQRACGEEASRRLGSKPWADRARAARVPLSLPRGGCPEGSGEGAACWLREADTFCTMSRWPWLAARCSGVSSPRFMTLMRAPRMISMSTTLERPSRQAQCKGLKPWSSLWGRQGQLC